MEFKDITTWTVTPDHKARPKNPFDYDSSVEYTAYERFATFAKEHVYHCSPSLVAGEYPAADLELIEQYQGDSGNWYKNEKDWPHEPDYEYRQYLQLKQPEKEAILKPNKMKTALELIADERQRQIDVYGYSDEHIIKSVEDYSCGELGDAAASYAMTIGFREDASEGANAPFLFPWDAKYFKPSPDNRIRELVKAAAMLVAEIDRLNNPDH